MLERDYQSRLIKRIRKLFPDCIILKNDTDYLQGVPDLLILFDDKWAALEVKASSSTPVQPNQDYYIRVMDTMSFASFVCPDNEREVLDALQYAFGVSRPARVP